MKKILAIIISVVLFQANSYGSDLPAILDDLDYALYQEIFKLQSEGKYDEADKKIVALDNDSLVSIVLYERFMTPKYITKSKELIDWLSKYNNTPGAQEIYKLAINKTPKAKKNKIKKPIIPTPATGSKSEWADSERLVSGTYNKVNRKKISSFQSSMKKGKTKICRNVLEDKQFKKSISKSDYARMSGRLAFLYYVDANFELAREFGETGAEGNSEYGLWTMGLLSFKQENYQEAAKYFIKMTELNQINDARKTEALFWAGRAEQKLGNNDLANGYFTKAAEKPQIFYGALAAGALGEVPEYKFYESEISEDELENLMKNTMAVRALALIQLDKKIWAEKYFTYMLSDDITPDLLQSIHSIAESSDMPRIAIQTSRLMKDKGVIDTEKDMIMGALYPTPDWEPMDGWELDKCLLFAITRQESQFKTNAKSRVGATGLMQLMPGTARLMCSENNINLKSLDLLKPEHNMFLGQKYVAHLLEKAYIDNNLVKMLISYNAGAGNLLKWEKKFQTEDPLLYVESFPARETRDYVKKVLTNLWLYSAKMDQPMDTLMEMANGDWPRYNSDNSVATSKKDNDTL